MDVQPMDAEGSYSIAEIAQLIDNLKHIDTEVRLRSVQELPVISAALGPERTRRELLPYLLDSMDDDEEVLAALAEQLKNFVGLVGGPQFVQCLLPAFELLSSTEDTVVREKATDSMAAVIAAMDERAVRELAIPLVERLSKGDWFSTRASACGLYPSVCQRVDPRTLEMLVGWYAALITDKTPMVRRAAATHLKNLVPALSKELLQSAILPLFFELSKDAQDSVRLLVVTLIAPIIRLHGGFVPQILPSFHTASKDASWRVRYMAADTIVEIQRNAPNEVIIRDLLPVFTALLEDPEAEVRAAISAKVLDFCTGLPEDVRCSSVQSQIMPRLKSLVVDESQHVRAALASVIMGLAPLLGKEITIEALLPLFLQLLKDDCSEVRLNIISHLENVNRVIGISDLSQSLLPAINELALDPSWRVRQQIIEYIPLVSKQLGVEFFNLELLTLCIKWLDDRVAAVRLSAAQNIRNLVSTFGMEWAKNFILPRVLELAQERKFVMRLTTLQAINLLLGVCSAESITNFILPVVCSLRTDKIPNIRFNVAKTLQVIAPMVEKSAVENLIRPALEELSQDSDVDVRFFAERAADALESTIV